MLIAVVCTLATVVSAVGLISISEEQTASTTVVAADPLTLTQEVAVNNFYGANPWPSDNNPLVAGNDYVIGYEVSQADPSNLYTGTYSIEITVSGPSTMTPSDLVVGFSDASGGGFSNPTSWTEVSSGTFTCFAPADSAMGTSAVHFSIGVDITSDAPPGGYSFGFQMSRAILGTKLLNPIYFFFS